MDDPPFGAVVRGPLSGWLIGAIGRGGWLVEGTPALEETFGGVKGEGGGRTSPMNGLSSDRSNRLYCSAYLPVHR